MVQVSERAGTPPPGMRSRPLDDLYETAPEMKRPIPPMTYVTLRYDTNRCKEASTASAARYNTRH